MARSAHYLQPQTLGSIVRSSIAIYFANFITFFAIYVIPLIPVLLVRLVAIDPDDPPIAINAVWSLVEFLVGTVVIFPATIAVSEVCLGMRPTVLRAYGRAFANPGAAIGSYFLQIAVILLGVLLLIIPGLIFAVWYFFVGPVALLEGLYGKRALARSRELGKGHYLRNFGIFVAIIILIYVLYIPILAIIVVLSLFIPETPAVFIGAILLVSLNPIVLIAIVLLYYDMRARKEGYGAEQLAEDLKL